MFILHAHKKLYALLLCSLLMVQPLQSMFSDKTYNDAIFCLFFFGGCALLGIISSHSKKIVGPKTKIEPNFASSFAESFGEHNKASSDRLQETQKEISQELKNKITAVENETKKIWLRLNKHNIDLPIVFSQINTLFTEKEERIKNLEHRCSALEKQNTQLLTMVEKKIQCGISGYVPAFVAAHWFHAYTQQTKTFKNYSQEKNLLTIMNKS